jgi:hypothetical protein
VVDPAEDTGRLGEAASTGTSGAGAPVPAGSAGGLRLLAAAATLPWLLLYGTAGAWAVARALWAMRDGLPHLDAGYTRLVTPAGLLFVGALLLTAFATLLAVALLLLFAHRGRAAWLTVLVAAVMLTAGAVWAAATGGLHPGLWLLYFFGLLYSAAAAAVQLARVTRHAGRGRIAEP